MTIKRDILGNLISIELTEMEMKEAHIAYLRSELDKVEDKPVRIEKQAEIMPKEPAVNHKERLYKCREEIALYRNQAFTVGKVIDEHIDEIAAAYASGMSTVSIATILGVSKNTLNRHLIKNGFAIRPSIHDVYADYVA